MQSKVRSLLIAHLFNIGHLDLLVERVFAGSGQTPGPEKL